MRLAWIGTLVAAAAIGGCGEGDAKPSAPKPPDPIGAQQAAESMMAELRGGWIKDGCEHLSPDGRLRLEGTRHETCVKALRGTIYTTYTYDVSDLTVSPDGRQAAVRVHNDEEQSNVPLLLEPSGSRWKVTMFGIQGDHATDKTLELVRKGGFDPEKHPELYTP